MGLSGAVIGLLYWPFHNHRSTELFASDVQTTAADALHPTERFTVDGQARTITDAFKQAGVEYNPADHVTAFPDPSLGLGSVVTVKRALPVQVQDGKRKITIRTWQSNLTDALAENELQLGNDDKITPALTTPLQANLAITITRVARTNVEEKTVVPFQTIQQNDDTMWRGETKVTQVGANGERTLTYLVIREDGDLVSKTLTSNVISTPVVNKIVRVGTKLKIGQTFSGRLTWYSANTKVAINSSTGLKKGQDIRVTNQANGKSIIVTIDDFCPASAGCSGIVDLNPTYFQQLQGDLYGNMPSVKVEEILN